MSAAGKKNRLKMKYPMKLWPLRPATRAGQNAIAIQTTASTIHQMVDMTYPPISATDGGVSAEHPPDAQSPMPPRCADTAVGRKGRTSRHAPQAAPGA